MIQTPNNLVLGQLPQESQFSLEGKNSFVQVIPVGNANDTMLINNTAFASCVSRRETDLKVREG